MRFELHDDWQNLKKPKIKFFKAYDYLLIINFGFTLLLFSSFFPFIQSQSRSNHDLNSSKNFNLTMNQNENVQPLIKYHCSPWISSKLFKKFRSKVQNYSNIEICSNLIQFKSKITKSSINSSTQKLKTVLDQQQHYSQAFSGNEADSQVLSNSCNRSASITDYKYNLSEYESIFKNFNKNKCLSSANKSVDKICDLEPSQRLEQIKVSYLQYCSNYPLASLLNPQAWLNLNSINRTLCVNILNELIKLDSLAQNIFLQFDQLLSRYNCKSYSVKGTCSQCKVSAIFFFFLLLKRNINFYFRWIYYK